LVNWLIKKEKQIFLILLLALILRLVALNQSLWLDEAIGAIAVRDFSYTKILTEFLKFDNHPPLYYFALKFWTNIFGYSEAALRSLSILFGLGVIYLTYKIAREINPVKNNFYPILTALLISTSQFHIYYSQEARMYSMAAFLATLLIFLLLKILKYNKIHFWLGFSLTLALLISTDYMPLFLLPLLVFTPLVYKKNPKWWVGLATTLLPLLLLAIFWFPTFKIQSERGNWLINTLPAWKSVAGGASAKQAILVWTKFVLGRISIPNKLIYSLLIFLASAPFIIAFASAIAKINKGFIVLVLWLFTPLIFGFIVSFWIPAFIYFRFLFILPAFYLIAAWGVSRYKFKPVRNTLVILLLGINLIGWFIYIIDKNQQREDWKNATRFVEESAKKSEVVIFTYPAPFAPYRWYEKGIVDAVGVADSISANKEATINNTKEAIKGKNAVFYFEYLSDLSDPNGYVRDTLEREGYQLDSIYNFTGTGQIYYLVKAK